MSIEQVAAFRTSDGALHDNAEKARDHEFELAMDAYFKELREDFNTDQAHTIDDIALRLVDDRHKVKAIFSLLNGAVSTPGMPLPSQDSRFR